MAKKSDQDVDRNLRDQLMAIGGFTLGVSLAAAFTHIPGSAADWAGWAQAIGTVSAIAGAYWVGERASRDSKKREFLAKVERYKAYLAIADMALIEGRRVELEVGQIFDLPAARVQGVADERWASEAANALTTVPLQE